MSYEPPFDLDPHVAIRDPDSLPMLMVRAMHRVMASRKGLLPSRFIESFNIAAWTLTTAGRKKTGAKTWRNEGKEARLIEGTLDPSPAGLKLEEAAKKKPDTDQKLDEIKRWAKAIYATDPSRYDKTWKEAN